jgi:hypothetical protein
MSREIDLTKKLSPEDREYLYQRNGWRLVKANYEEFGGDDPVVAEGVPVTGPESLVDAAGLDALTPEQQQAAQAGEAGDGADYESMTKPELQAELDVRKKDAATDEERANLAYKSGENKDQLIARLDKDDELVSGRPE